MTLRARLIIAGATLAAVLAVGGVLSLASHGASAGNGGTFDDGRELLPLAKISVAEAIGAAQAAARGDVDEIDLEYWRGRLVFNVDVGDKDVKVDAATGEVLSADEDD